MNLLIFKNTFLSILLISVSLMTLSAQSGHSLLRDGNKFYNLDEYSLAEEKYRKSLEEENQSKTAYNLGNALYSQQRYEEAIEQYQKASGGGDENLNRGDVFHNMGNAYFQGQQFEEALKSYKQAVRLNPEDEATKYNLMVTKEMIKQMQQQQQQEQQESGEGEESESEEKENQEGEQNEGEGQENQESQDGSTPQDSTDIQEGGGFDSTRLEKQTLDSLDAVKLLQIVEGEEQKVQEKLRKFNSDRKKQDKDW